MEFSIELGAMAMTKAQWLLYMHFESDRMDIGLENMDECFADHEGKKVGPLTELRKQGNLTGALEEIEVLKNFPHLEAKNLILAGLGPREDLSLDRFNAALRAATVVMAARKSQVMAIVYPYQVLEMLGESRAISELAMELTRLFQNPKAIVGKTLHPFKQVKLLGPIPTPENEAAWSRGVESVSA